MQKRYIRPEHREHSPYRNRQDIMDRINLSPDKKKVNVYLATRVRKRTASPSKYPKYADRMILLRKSATPKRKTPVRSKKYTSKKKKKPEKVTDFEDMLGSIKESIHSKNSSKKLAPSEKLSTSKISIHSKKSKKSKIDFNSRQSGVSNNISKGDDQLNMIVNLYK